MTSFAPSATGHRQPASQTVFIFSLPTLDLTATQSFDDCSSSAAANYILITLRSHFSKLDLGIRGIAGFTGGLAVRGFNVQSPLSVAAL